MANHNWHHFRALAIQLEGLPGNRSSGVLKIFLSGSKTDIWGIVAWFRDTLWGDFHVCPVSEMRSHVSFLLLLSVCCLVNPSRTRPPGNAGFCSCGSASFLVIWKSKWCRSTKIHRTKISNLAPKGQEIWAMRELALRVKYSIFIVLCCREGAELGGDVGVEVFGASVVSDVSGMCWVRKSSSMQWLIPKRASYPGRRAVNSCNRRNVLRKI